MSSVLQSSPIMRVHRRKRKEGCCLLSAYSYLISDSSGAGRKQHATMFFRLAHTLSNSNENVGTRPGILQDILCSLDIRPWLTFWQPTQKQQLVVKVIELCTFEGHFETNLFSISQSYSYRCPKMPQNTKSKPQLLVRRNTAVQIPRPAYSAPKYPIYLSLTRRPPSHDLQQQSTKPACSSTCRCQHA